MLLCVLDVFENFVRAVNLLFLHSPLQSTIVMVSVVIMAVDYSRLVIVTLVMA